MLWSCQWGARTCLRVGEFRPSRAKSPSWPDWKVKCSAKLCSCSLSQDSNHPPSCAHVCANSQVCHFSTFQFCSPPSFNLTHFLVLFSVFLKPNCCGWGIVHVNRNRCVPGWELSIIPSSYRIWKEMNWEQNVPPAMCFDNHALNHCTHEHIYFISLTTIWFLKLF